jgi:hypothetical protein
MSLLKIRPKCCPTLFCRNKYTNITIYRGKRSPKFSGFFCFFITSRTKLAKKSPNQVALISTNTKFYEWLIGFRINCESDSFTFLSTRVKEIGLVGKEVIRRNCWRGAEICPKIKRVSFAESEKMWMGDRGFDLFIYLFDPSRWRFILRSDVELTIL